MSSADKKKIDFIYFLPGIMGSTLHGVDGAQTPIWTSDLTALIHVLAISPEALAKAAKPGEVIKDRPMSPVENFFGRTPKPMYGSLLSFLQKQCPKACVVPFAYDWRKSNFESARQFVDRVHQDRRLQARIFVVAHSMGGIVALLAAQMMKDNRVHQQSYNKVARIINIGTPHLGSATAYKSLHDGRPYLAPLLDRYCNFIRGFTEGAVKDLGNALRAFQSIYELLPPREIGMLEMKGVTINSFDKKVWRADMHPRALSAESVHKLLKSVPTEKLYTIYGYKKPTEMGYHLTENYKRANPISLGAGDKTVSMQSAQGAIDEDRRKPLTNGVEHLGLVNDDEVRKKLEELLT